MEKVLGLPRYQLSRKTDENGNRVYQNPLGTFRSVTSILSATSDNSKLDAWRERVGEDAADLICKLATRRGNLTHDHTEQFLLCGIEPKFDFASAPFWKSIKPFLDRVEKVAILEASVWHPDRFAGALDGIVWLDKSQTQPILVDWKTAEIPINNIKEYTYKLQVSAYRKAANYVYKAQGLNLAEAMIVVALPDQKAQIINISTDELDQCYCHFRARCERVYGTGAFKQ